jgi:hypothetical protein
MNNKTDAGRVDVEAIMGEFIRVASRVGSYGVLAYSESDMRLAVTIAIDRTRGAADLMCSNALDRAKTATMHLISESAELSRMHRERDEANDRLREMDEAVAVIGDLIDGQCVATDDSGFACMEEDYAGEPGPCFVCSISDVIFRLRAALSADTDAGVDRFIDIVFDGPPSNKSGRFVESEDPSGRSIRAGEWIDRGNGLWALRIRSIPDNTDADAGSQK